MTQPDPDTPQPIDWTDDFRTLHACIAVAKFVREVWASSLISVVLPGGKVGRVRRDMIRDRHRQWQ
jgi:hypothetical protein